METLRAPAPFPSLAELLPERLETMTWRLAASPAASAHRRHPRAILTREEVRLLVGRLRGTPRLAARLAYGGGLRAQEIVELRAGDVDWMELAVTVRGRGGLPDRRVPLPPTVLPGLERLLAVARRLEARDRLCGLAAADPRGRGPRLFPSSRLVRDQRSGRCHRPALDPRRIECAIARAARAVGLPRGTGCRTLRASCAAHLLEAGWTPDRVRALLGHRGA